jgi:hypothetical protein
VNTNASAFRELTRRYAHRGQPDLWALNRVCPAIPQRKARGLVDPNGPGRTASSGSGRNPSHQCRIERAAASVARAASDITAQATR